MSYTTTSQLEREARSKGDPLIWQAFFRSYVDSDTNVRNKCYSILAENPEGAKQPALEKLVEKGGVWIEVDRSEKGFMHVHGVRDQTGPNQQPYTLSWKRKIFEARVNGQPITQFEEGELLQLLQETDAYLPSTKQIDTTFRAIETINAHGYQNRPAAQLLRNILASIGRVMHTSTHIEGQTLIHGWNTDRSEYVQRGSEFEFYSRVLGTTDDCDSIRVRYYRRVNRSGLDFSLIADGQIVLIGGGEFNPVRFTTQRYPDASARLVKATPIASTENAR